MRRAILLSLCACACAAGATPVSAAPRTLDLAAGPFVAGRGVTWLDVTQSSFVLRTAQPGASTTTLARGTLTNCSIFDDPDCASTNRGEAEGVLASAGRYVLTRHSSSSTQYGGSVDDSLVTAPLRPASELERLESCHLNYGGGGAPYPPFATQVAALDGYVVADACGGAQTLRIRDYGVADAPARDVAFGAPITGVAVAGRWVAVRLGVFSDARIAVWDRYRGTQAFTAPEPSAAFDIQDDGTLAVADVPAGDGACRSGRLAWYSPAAPTAHVLAARPCEARVVIDGGFLAVIAGDATTRRVDAFDLAGAGGPVAALGPPRAREGSLDTAGGRVAFAVRGCDQRALLRNVALAPRVSVAPISADCPASVRANSLRATRSGNVAVPVVCGVGCTGSLSLAIARSAAGTASFRLASSPRVRRVRVRLSRGQRRRLAQARRLQATLVVNAWGLDGRTTTTNQSLLVRAPPG